MEYRKSGNKNDSECYFLVKDVASGFDIKRLYSILINCNSGYEINTHYVYFNIPIVKKNNTTGAKKELFLTHIGFIQFVYRSRINNVKYKKTIYRWLSQFKSKTPKKFILDIEKMSKESKIGFTYLISSPLLNAIKIGAWRSTLIIKIEIYNRIWRRFIIICYKNSRCFCIGKKMSQIFCRIQIIQ
nr:Uncharacterized protein [Megavirus caiporensis]